MRTTCLFLFKTLCIFIKKLKSILLVIFIPLLTLSLSAQEINLRGKWKFHIGDKQIWSSFNFDDSNWEEIYAPAPWEDEGFNGYDGFAWYRKKFDGHKLDKEASYSLNLGFIDDADEVYVNGQLIGFTGKMPPHFKTAYTMERKYLLPDNIINFSGYNTIAVRVFDVTHAGGIIDGRLGIFRFQKNPFLLINLQGIWSFATSMDDKPISHASDWKKIIVPDEWEHQGYRGYDGFAWYKRTFEWSEKLANENLILLLGKIDDFDKVYLNGKLIGSTNDHEPFGLSHSYMKNRAYKIPRELLKKGVNTIEVLVEDMGNIGGIYEGTIGITTVSNYEKHFER